MYRTFSCLSTFLLLASGTSLAGDRLKVSRVAFDATGDHALIMLHGVRDSNGFGAAQLHVLNTSTGRHWQAATESRRTPANSAALLQTLLGSQWAAIKASGYRSGTTSTPRYQRSISTHPTWQEGAGTGETQNTSVKLWSQAVPVELQVASAQTPCPGVSSLPAGQSPARFVLRVQGQQVAASAVPCAARYSLERVDVKGNRAVFTLRAYTPGLKGPNAEPYFVAVTLH